MKFIEELRVFLGFILKWLYFFLGLLLFVFIFGVKEFIVLNKSIFLPFPSYESFTVIFFRKIVSDLVPEGIELLVTSPLEAFWAQLSVSFFLAFAITFPVLGYNLFKYLFPAFTRNEKLVVFKILFPSAVLFFLGCIFSYYFLIPATIEILYTYYVKTIGVVSFFALKEFIPFVLSLVLGVGIVFVLPVFMVLLTFLGLVSAEFWKENWKHSLLIFLILSAIITPDGSGITMMFLSVPLILLYSIGYLISKKIVKDN
jgi:sec-independent protein translocase protein TatC